MNVFCRLLGAQNRLYCTSICVPFSLHFTVVTDLRVQAAAAPATVIDLTGDTLDGEVEALLGELAADAK